MLTAVEVKNFKKSEKIQCFTDEKGLYLEVRPNGSKYWRLKYRFAGKENRLSLGVYPDVSLAKARESRDIARKQLKNGIDPSQQRKIDKINRSVQAANTFEAVALVWYSTKKPEWSESHAQTTLERLRRDLLPWLGSRPLNELSPPEILATLDRINKRGTTETARRCRGYVSQIFDFAISTGRSTNNPAKSLSAALPKTIGGHHPAIVDPVRFGAMLRDIETYAGNPITRAALQIHALTFQRPNEVSGMAWTEIDLPSAMWVIPATRMKSTKQRKATGQPHRVPLSRQAIAVLIDLQPLTGSGKLVFPSERGQGRCISENTARMALRGLGYSDHTPHGFRASVRTMAREQLHIDREVIERQLSHGSSEALGGAYDRTQYLSERITLMQSWADYLDKLRTGISNVINIRAA